MTTTCTATCSANGRRCEAPANHEGFHDFIGVPHVLARLEADGILTVGGRVDDPFCTNCHRNLDTDLHHHKCGNAAPGEPTRPMNLSEVEAMLALVVQGAPVNECGIVRI